MEVCQTGLRLDVKHTLRFCEFRLVCKMVAEIPDGHSAISKGHNHRLLTVLNTFIVTNTHTYDDMYTWRINLSK